MIVHISKEVRIACDNSDKLQEWLDKENIQFTVHAMSPSLFIASFWPHDADKLLKWLYDAGDSLVEHLPDHKQQEYIP